MQEFGAFARFATSVKTLISPSPYDTSAQIFEAIECSTP